MSQKSYLNTENENMSAATAINFVKRIETLGSDIERRTTTNFVNSNQWDIWVIPTGRIFAIYEAAIAVSVSSAMVFIHPTQGIIQGTVGLVQTPHEVTDHTWTILAGFGNSLCSLYNIGLVASTALLGLLPYLNGRMYNAMPVNLCARDLSVMQQQTQDSRQELDQVVKQAQQMELITADQANA